MGPRSRFVTTTLFAIVALGGAGLAVAADREPSRDQRPEAMWAADETALPYIGTLNADLSTIQAPFASLAQAGRATLENVQALSINDTRSAIADGDGALASVSDYLPNLEADYRAANAHIDRSALGPETTADMVAIDAAVAAVADGEPMWTTIKNRATLVIQLLDDLTQHDSEAFRATTAGRQSAWSVALADLSSAGASVTDARGVRDQLAADATVDTLDDLLNRYDAYDGALRSMYEYLGSGGTQSGAQFDALQRAAGSAQAALPSDNGALSLIVGEAAGTSISDALVALERDRGSIDDAISTATATPSAGAMP